SLSMATQNSTFLLGSRFEPCTMAFASASRRAISTSHSLPTAQPISFTKSITQETTGAMVATSAGPEKRSRTASLSDSNSHCGIESGAICAYLSGACACRKAKLARATTVSLPARIARLATNRMRREGRMMGHIFVQIGHAKQQFED